MDFRVRGLLLTVLAFGLCASAGAVPCTEVGDAGPLPGVGVGDCSAIGGLDSISGAITATGDVDMYLIYINNPAAFSATTVGQPGTLGDTQLFLFTSAGFGIATNDDDASTSGFRSTLPVGHPLYSSLSAGLYYLAISGYNTDPANASGLIFPSTFPGVFGATGPGGGLPIAGYLGGSGVGTYDIALTGVGAVPEPGTLILLGSGIAGLALRRRRRAGA
jgi:hypothetical protein